MSTSLKRKLFLSSTCYNHADLRNEIEKWAESNGYDLLLSDRPTFPVDPSMHRHDVCLANVKKADLFVLVIGARFGARYYADQSISVTWAEYRTAVASKVKMAIFVDERVWAERNVFRKDDSAKPVVTEKPETFAFIDELQENPMGHWFQIFKFTNDIKMHLNGLTILFAVPPPEKKGGIKYKEYKYIETDGLSSEAKHHIRITYGKTEQLSDYDLHDAISNIPEVVQETGNVNWELDGFTVYIEELEQGRYLVRPTDLGLRVRQELWDAYLLI